MSDPPPILTYAAPHSRDSLRIAVGVILIFWCAFDLVSAAILALAGVLTILDTHALDAIIPSLLAIIASSLILTYAGLAIFWGIAILKNRPNAARSARLWTLLGEVLCWTGFLIVLPLIAVDKYPHLTGDEFRMGIGISLAILIIPAAVTVTRCLLTRLVRAAQTHHAA